MDFSSLFKRGDKSPAAKPVNDSQDAVHHMRVRARRRLIGAAVLVVVGVIGFPLLFETQPRPIPIDLPIDIPRKETAPALTVPAPVAAQAPASVAAPVPAPVVAEKEVVEGGEKIIEPPPKPVEKVAEKTVDKPVEKAASKPVEKIAAKPAAPAPKDAARVQAILEGKSADKPAAATAAADKSRFIVQVGAFADASSAHEARMKVEKVGLKTYTQAVDTPGGKRIRVRVGPFADRAEADKAAAKLRSTGLTTAVLTL